VGLSGSTGGRFLRLLDLFAGWWLREQHDTHAMQALEPLSRRYAPWNAFAMRPAGLAAVLNDIVANHRTHVVECGGGVSTLFIARLLSEREGRLQTIEDDRRWAELLAEELASEGLDQHATVTFAPPEPTAVRWADENARWYSTSVLEQTVTGPIDLLLVDGPSAYTRATRHARYPALPYFHPLLAPDCAIFLDDVRRRGERDVLARWEHEFDLRFERRYTRGGIAIARSPQSFRL
jgi:predicted O-methyltransferase YrrM